MMLKASASQLLAAFEQVHGKMTGSCHAEVLYDDSSEVVGVACMKNGTVAWRSTIAEITFDLLIDKMAVMGTANREMG